MLRRCVEAVHSHSRRTGTPTSTHTTHYVMKFKDGFGSCSVSPPEDMTFYVDYFS